MAHQSGNAASPNDLLQKLSTWLTAVGWTQDMLQATGSGWRLHAHKGAAYINIRSVMNETSSTGAYFYNQADYAFSGFLLYVGTGFSAGSAWNQQPGGPLTSGGRVFGVGCPTQLTALTKYHFFTTDANNDNVVVILEKTPGIFSHFGWGASLNKVGSWTGGAYFFGAVAGGDASASNQATGGPGYANQSAYPPFTLHYSGVLGYVRVDSDSILGKWAGISTTSSDSQGYTGLRGASALSWDAVTGNCPVYNDMVRKFTNTLNGQSVLVPQLLAVIRDTGGSSLLGTVPGIYLTNACASGFASGTDYLWGADTYTVFPGPSSDPQNGFAVKKVL